MDIAICPTTPYFGYPWQTELYQTTCSKPIFEDPLKDTVFIQSPNTNDADDYGMLLDSKNLYRPHHHAEWREWSTSDLEIDALGPAASAKFALIVKHEKQQEEDGSIGLSLHSVQVQSPLIKEALGPVFNDYPGINTNLKKVTFHAPFNEFFYRWKNLLQAVEYSKKNETRASHLSLLFDIVSAHVKPQVEVFKDLLANRVITFDYLWALFEPGMDVYSIVNGRPRLYRSRKAEYVNTQAGKVFIIHCNYVDTDGTNFGFASEVLTIHPFADVSPITGLSVVPAYLQPGIVDIRAELSRRGRKFASLKGTHYKAYSGDYELAKPTRGRSPLQTLQDGRIMIDAAMFQRYHREFYKRLDSLSAPAKTDRDDKSRYEYEYEYDFKHYDDFEYPRSGSMGHRPIASSQGNSTTVPDELYAYCAPTVQGFCLSTKQWVFLHVDFVKEITWNENAYDSLVLPHDYKRLIRGFVQTQLDAQDTFDDVMSGKGRGIIMLLSGEPGTGKTLTAESVSEVMRKPLYSMGAGELGESAEEVEYNLQRVLEISAKWGVVLLLDECDVFLEQRSSHSSVRRNKVVSVFLRLLEYYQGVIFLTTNRVDSFDPAFESRIHLTIQFPRLDFASRLHIWRTFVNPVQEGGSTGDEKYASEVTDDELKELAHVDLNGRQIKNVVKTARLLAASERTLLSMDHVKAVLRVKQGMAAEISEKGI